MTQNPQKPALTWAFIVFSVYEGGTKLDQSGPDVPTTARKSLT